jgi:uncharacterized protein (TIGR03435 family)
MRRRIFLLCALIAIASAQDKPAFEVVSIKPSDPATLNGGIKGNPGGQTFSAVNLSLRFLIKYAYKISDSQVAAGPDWLDKDRYDIQMKAEHPINRTEFPALVKSMLTDNFKLQFHKETRTQTALVMTTDKAGSKMKPNDGPDEWEISVQYVPNGPPPAPVKVKGVRCSMMALAYWIAQIENRAVVDKTELPGYYDFTIEYAPNVEQPVFDGPNLITALRQQLGLKMESAKTPVEVYVIDRAEKPADN